MVTFSGRNGQRRTAFDPNYKNFGPRLDFAYNAPFSKDLVIRGGGGIATLLIRPPAWVSPTTSAT